jgi:hypothetical protein
MRALRMVILGGLVGCNAHPFSELMDQGVGDYLGIAEVKSESSEDGVDTYVFKQSSGPMCLRGTDFNVSVREKKNSDELMIFLQGGGACWSDFCLAVETAREGIPSALEVLDDSLKYNPVRDMNVLYVPYCDASLFAGNIEIDDNGDGETDRYHRGLQNLSAALDIAAERFPKPKRVVLAGSSGGAFGTILATVLVREIYPRIPIYVIADSGVGVAKGAEDPDFVMDLVEEWGAEPFLPESCPDCLADGHLTPLVAWELDQDPNLKVGVFSAYQDQVMSQIFLAITGPEFEVMVKEQTRLVSQEFPDRYVPFLIEGEVHTTLLGEVSGFLGDDFEFADAIGDLVTIHGMQTSIVGDLDFATWFDYMLSDSPKWKPARE